MSAGSSDLDAIRRRIFEIVTENEDIDALLEECLPEGTNKVFTGSCLPIAVDGILMALENQCILSGCSPSVLSASIFGDRVKKLVSAMDGQLLLDENRRSQMFVFVETCKRLVEQNLFNRKVFAKSVNKDTVLPLEVIWRLEKESLMSLDLFITSNLSRPSVIGGLAQNVATLCTGKDGETAEMMKLRIQVVTDLLVSLLALTYGTELPDDVTARGVRKVSSALLDSITKKLLQLEGAKRDINIFENLLGRCPAIDGQVLKKYGFRQLTVMLSSSAVFKVSDALGQQNVWTFCIMDKFLRSLYEHLLTIFETSEVIELMHRLLEQNEVNWRSLLSFVSVLLVCDNNAKVLFYGLVEGLLREAMSSLNLDKIITAMLLGRHGCLEGAHIFMSYQEWFQKMFGDANSSLCNNKKSFSFLMKFLTDIVPHEPAAYLKAHLQKPPFIPPKCRPLWSDYTTIAKTRLLDLKESAEDASLFGDGPKPEDNDRTSQVETDIEKAISTFEKNLKLPTSILEASIFRKSYFTGKFLPTLLQPRPLPCAPDLKMKFIAELHRAGKIPDVQYAEYKEKCRTLTEQLLEGVFDVDDDDDDELFSVEEQLQRSLIDFRDTVLQGHLEMKEIDRQVAAVSENLFAVTKYDATKISVACQEVLVNVEEANLSRENVKIAHAIVDIICQISSALPCSASSWLDRLLLMLFRHPVVLQSMCVVLFHLLTDQETKLVSCHIPGLVAVLKHWTVSDNCKKQLVVLSKAGNQTPFVSHVLDSLPMVSGKSMRFSLEFATEFLHCSQTFLQKQKAHQNIEHMEVEGENFCQTETSSAHDGLEAHILPKQILHIIEYAGPRMFQRLRLASNFCEVQKYQNQEWQNSSGIDPLLKSLLNVISIETIWSCLQRNDMTFREWVEQEMRMVDDVMTFGERISYYDWVVFVRRYRHSGNQESPELHVYMEMCCATLINVMIDFEVAYKAKRSKHDKHGEMRKQNNSETPRSIIQTDLFHLLQKLALDLDHFRKTTSKNQLWLWKVLEERCGELEKSDNPVIRIQQESEVYTFCEVLLLLPPGLMVSNTFPHLLNDEMVQSSIINLLWFINEIARNYTNNGLSLPPSLTCHLVGAIATLPPSCNEAVARFLSECPLAISSMILNWPAVGHLRQMTLCGTTLSSVFEETERLMQATERYTEYNLSSSDTRPWTEGLAAFAQIQAGRDIAVLTSCLSQDTKAVLHECMIIKVARDVLHGKLSNSPPGDLLRLYEISPDLQCFTSKVIMTKFDLCTASAIQQILPFVRVYIFVVVKELHLLSRFSNAPQNLKFIIANYNEAVKRYDSIASEHWTLIDRSVMEILSAASAKIISMINASSAAQLQAIDSVLFTDSDMQLKVAYNKRVLETKLVFDQF